MTVLQRVQAPTPKFFRKVRNGSVIVAGLSASLFGAPALLPPLLLTIAGYLSVAGAVASAVSQAATNGDGQSVAKKEDGDG